MATESSASDTAIAPASSPSSDFQISSQPLVIDCPDPVMAESASRIEGSVEAPPESVSSQLHDKAGSNENAQETAAQPCDMLLPAQSSADQQQGITSGSTIAQTLQELVSPGSGVFATVQTIPQTATVIQSQVNADGGMTIIGDGASQQQQQQQQVQFLTSQLQSPVMFSGIEAHHIQQQVIQQRPGSSLAVVSISASTPRSSQAQPSMCQLAQSATQGLVAGQQAATVTGFQGLVGQSATVFGNGTQMLCPTADATPQQQMDIAMACQQQYTIQTAATQGFQSPQMVTVPQTLQVIQAAGPQMVQQQCLQQQYMIQTNQVQTIQPASSLSSPRPTVKSQNVLPIAPQSSSQSLGSRPLTVATVAKGTVTTAAQATSYTTLKPVQQAQQQNAPVVIGQLGVVPNAQVVQQNILSQQPRAISLCSVNQPLNLGQVNQQLSLSQIGQSLNLGQVGQHLQFGQPVNLGSINQPLNFGPVNQALNLGQVNQALNLGQVNQTLNLGTVNQMIGGQTQIRLATMPNLSFNTGQLVGNAPTVLNFQNVPMMQQQLLTSQPTTILGSQPLYIRAAEPFVQQQMPTIAVANVQSATPVRNIVMTQSVQPATSTPSQPQTLRRLQVQPNSSIAPATNSKQSSGSLSSSSATPVAPKPSPKPVKQQPASTPTLAAKTIAPATASSTSRPVKPATAVPVTPKPQPMSVLTALSSNVASTTACPVTVQASGSAVTMSTSVVSAAVSTPASTALIAASSLSVVSSPPTSGKRALTESVINELEKPVINSEEPKLQIKLEDDKKTVAQELSSIKEKPKAKKPKILTHVIEGFIIQEASEPFPVHGSSLISQLWSPKLPVSADDGYSSPKSEKDSEDEVDEDQEKTEVVEAKKPKLEESSVPVEPAVETTPVTPIVIAPKPASPEVPTPTEPARLTCEFCGKRDLVQNFARSRRFCSVTCSKRFSAYSMRKAPDGSVTGRPPNASSKPNARRTAVINQVQNRPSPGNNEAVGATTTPQQVSRAVDPRVTVIKSSVASVSPSESSDTETSSGAGTASNSCGDSSSSSQLSPPALERVERITHQETAANGDDGVLIPSKPLSQWGVQEVYDFIRTLPGCGMYADDFLQQEIDGSALMLLKEDHLMTTMNVKLGPALKICSKISSLKE